MKFWSHCELFLTVVYPCVVNHVGTTTLREKSVFKIVIVFFMYSGSVSIVYIRRNVAVKKLPASFPHCYCNKKCIFSNGILCTEEWQSGQYNAI